MEEVKDKTTSAREGESMDQWLARALREAAIEGTGLMVSCNVTLSPLQVKRLVMPTIDEAMLFAVLSTADHTRQSVMNMLTSALVLLHPEKFPGAPSNAEAVPPTAQEAALPAGAEDARPDPTEGDEERFVPLTAVH